MSVSKYILEGYALVSLASIFIGGGIVGKSKANKGLVKRLESELDKVSDDLNKLKDKQTSDIEKISMNLSDQIREFNNDVYRHMTSVESVAETQYKEVQQMLRKIVESIGETKESMAFIQGELKRKNGV